MTRISARFGLALAALMAALPAAAEPAADAAAILKKALAAKPCPAFETAQGWVIHRSSPVSDLTGAASEQVTAVDRSRRRYVSIIRQTRPDTEGIWRVTRFAYGDGQFYACSADAAESCALQPLASDEVPPEDITSAWVALGDLRASDHGGAAVTLAEVPAGVVNAIAAISLTPQGGRPYILYIGEDGAIIATDMQAPSHTVRTWLGDFQEIAGCSTPTTMRVEILPDRAGQYLVWQLRRFDYRSSMTPEDTAFD
ncbi:MAG: hypothetical protein QM698_15185 [Micropepsaceae bacterium]